MGPKTLVPPGAGLPGAAIVRFVDQFFQGAPSATAIAASHPSDSMILRRRMGLLLPTCVAGISSSTALRLPAGTWRAWRRHTSGDAILCSPASDHLLLSVLKASARTPTDTSVRGREDPSAAVHLTASPDGGCRHPSKVWGRRRDAHVRRPGVLPGSRYPPYGGAPFGRSAYGELARWNLSWVAPTPSTIRDRTASAARSIQIAISACAFLPAGSRTKSAGS